MKSSRRFKDLPIAKPRRCPLAMSRARSGLRATVKRVDAPYIVPDERTLTVFTDGACLPGPRRGGVGIRFVHTDEVGNETVFDLDEPGYSAATNNQMELQAVITGLQTLNQRRVPPALLREIRRVDIYTDATYLVENLSNAIYVWPANDWMTAAGTPVLNADLWKQLVHEYKKLRKSDRVDIKWGKGHSSRNPHNKAADKLAKASARRPTRASPAVYRTRVLDTAKSEPPAAARGREHSPRRRLRPLAPHSGLVAAVQDHSVPIRVAAGREVADPRVPRLGNELDPLRL
jgi:ribonuclease HI